MTEENSGKEERSGQQTVLSAMPEGSSSSCYCLPCLCHAFGGRGHSPLSQVDLVVFDGHSLLSRR